MIKISFSGLDGTGKSTQIKKLQNHLIMNGESVKLYHLFSKNQTVISKMHETKLGRQVVQFIRHIKNSQIGNALEFISRVINVVLDSIITNIHNSRIKQKYIIYDRYFYDILICIAYDFPKRSKLLFLLLNIIPKPEVIIIFDTDSKNAIERKPEHSLKSASIYRLLYLNLASELSIKPIDATDSIEIIFSKVLNKIKNL